METEPLTSIPPLPDNYSRAKAAVLAAMVLGPEGTEGPKGSTLCVMGFPKTPKNAPGRALRRTGSTTVGGYALLEDTYGRQYIRDARGTIRRVGKKTAR